MQFNKLKKEVTPKEELIGELRDKLKGYDLENHKINADKINLSTLLGNKEERDRMLQREIAQLKMTLDEKDRAFSAMLRDLSDLASAGDIKMTNIRLKRLTMRYNSIIMNSKSGTEQKDLAKFREFERQREHMEHQKEELQRTLERKEINLRADINRNMSQNSQLVSEINTLRKEKREFLQRIARLELQLKQSQERLVIQSQFQPESHSDQEFQAQPRQSSLKRSSSSSTITTIEFSQNRPLSRTSSAGARRVRTPDSNRGGRIIRGRNWSRATDALSRYGSIVDDIMNNTRRFEAQQQELSQLKDYVEQILEEQQQPQSQQQQQQPKLRTESAPARSSCHLPER